MNSTAWNHLSRISNQTQTSSELENKWGLEPAKLVQRFVIDWWAENRLPPSTPIIRDFPAGRWGGLGWRWRIYFLISVTVGGEKYKPPEEKKEKKSRHSALLSRVQFRQSNCLLGFWHKGQGKSSPVLAAPVIECYPQVPGRHRPCFLADTVFFQLCVEVKGLWGERRELMKQLMRSALCEMKSQEGSHSSGFLGLKLNMKSEFEFHCHSSVIFNWEIRCYLPFPFFLLIACQLQKRGRGFRLSD